MSIEKMRLTAAIAEGMGREIENDLENAVVKVHKLQGACDALQQAMKIISAMSTDIVEEFKSGKVQIDPTDETAVARYAVTKRQEVVAKLSELVEIAKVSAIKADGERAAFNAVVERFKKSRDEQLNKINAIRQQIQSGELVVDGDDIVATGTHHPVGTHPGPTLKSIRQAEELAKGNGIEKKPRSRRKKAPAEAPDDSNA